MRLSCHRYFRYLDENNLLDALPLEQWYGTCFAGVLTNQSLIRIWDKICGGSRKIVVFVFVTLFNWIWRTSRLSSTTQVPEIITIIDNVRFAFIFPKKKNSPSKPLNWLTSILNLSSTTA